MATLTQIVTAIRGILDDPDYTEAIVVDQINDALLIIAAGIEIPNRGISAPLPDLFTTGSVSTSLTLPYVSLPADYQRSVVSIYDSSSNIINPPKGGDYYAFSQFLKQISSLSLTETGSVYTLCIKGSKLYYQGIPSVSEVLGLHYYKTPTVLALDGDVPSCLPTHLQLGLLKHYVCKEIMGEKIEDGQDNVGIGAKYHTTKFFEYLISLTNFIGIDSSPQYYGPSEFEDRGACDV